MSMPFFSYLPEPHGSARCMIAKPTHRPNIFVAHAKGELRLKGFWEHAAAIGALRGWFFEKLDDSRLFEDDECSRLAGELVELARNNHGRLVP